VRHSGRLLATVTLGVALLASTSAFAAAAVRPRGVPGLSAKQVTVGAIVSQSGPLAADFKPYLSGVYAYFDYVNKELGGVNGRTINLQYALDDTSNPTTDVNDARTLVTADHVFGIVGVSTPFFQASSYLSTSGVPTFGYATGNVWGGPKNFFADYGSVLNYNSSIPQFAYIAHKTKATKIAVIALGYPASKAECKGAVTGLATYGKTYGFKMVYSNINEPFGANWGIEASKMRTLGVNMVVNCMDVNSNIGLSTAMASQGMKPVQLWLDGYDRNILKKNAAVMKNTYLMLQHVPFEAPSASFPGLALYFKEMVKYGFGADEYSDVALMGWESANTFTMGLRAAGKSPTQASVIAAINKITKDIGGPSGGVTAPVNWTLAHTKNTSPACETFVVTSGSSFVQPSFTKAAHPWVCFPLSGKANLNAPVKAPAGTPGA